VQKKVEKDKKEEERGAWIAPLSSLKTSQCNRQPRSVANRQPDPVARHIPCLNFNYWTIAQGFLGNTLPKLLG
jgi:hypothetical protein